LDGSLLNCLEKQYKDHLSGYHTWNQKDHADKWLLFEKNIGEKLSIDEVAVTNGELYTIVTNKAGSYAIWLD